MGKMATRQLVHACIVPALTKKILEKNLFSSLTSAEEIVQYEK
jgi:hypothetical protein